MSELSRGQGGRLTPMKNKGTGYLDINRVEIHEGDVLKIKDLEALYVVYWQADKLEFKVFPLTDLYEIVKEVIIWHPYDYFSEFHPAITQTTAEILVRFTEVPPRGK